MDNKKSYLEKIDSVVSKILLIFSLFFSFIQLNNLSFRFLTIYFSKQLLLELGIQFWKKNYRTAFLSNQNFHSLVYLFMTSQAQVSKATFTFPMFIRVIIILIRRFQLKNDRVSYQKQDILVQMKQAVVINEFILFFFIMFLIKHNEIQFLVIYLSYIRLKFGKDQDYKFWLQENSDKLLAIINDKVNDPITKELLKASVLLIKKLFTFSIFKSQIN